ncbi:MAG TPA: TRAP transporter large permease [Dehalococcoidia bacterium]|nr:TRAP transporter large permease [Dehalococcoidia bacterium]
MSPELIGVLGLLVMFVGLALGFHIGIILAITGFAGFVALAGFAKSLSLLTTTPYYTTTNYGFIALPMFIFMGELVFQGGIGTLLYSAASKWLGRLHGGLAMATVSSCAFFAALSGDSLSASATFGKIALPEMTRYNYDSKFACGAIAGAAGLAVLIPPSGVMILYCIFTEVSLGKLLIAGVIPGIMSAIIYMALIYFRVRLKPSLGPLSTEVALWKEKLIALGYIAPVAVVMVVMLGGIYLGVFSPIEAAAIGAFTVLVEVVVLKKLSLTTLRTAMVNVAKTTAMIFWVIIGAMIFSKFLVLSGLPDALSVFISGLPVPNLVILIIILLIYIALGCFMSVVAMLAITLPIFFPLLTGLGFDGVWLGILIVLEVEMAAITPPIGMNVYVLKATVGDLVSTGGIFRGVVPFFLADILILAILVAFPQISLWLPSTMFQ